MYFFHVRISQKSSKAREETKLDLSEHQLRDLILQPYDEGRPIVVNGKTIVPGDIDRIQVSRSTQPSAELIEAEKLEDRTSPIAILGGPSYEWRAAARAEDVTDKYITAPPGHKRRSQRKTIDQKVLDFQAHRKQNPKSPNKVFVVHGHDHALKNDLEVFLHDIGLRPIVLHREPDEGQTLIEKLEKHSDVAYAIVLLTPDDIGFSASKALLPEKDRGSEQRARQNVIFEFGYFAALLGRPNVCCLYKSGVALPSDLNGFIYKEVARTIEDVGYSLIRELRTAGLKPRIR
jgi:predicted nucleotide-binding protein